MLIATGRRATLVRWRTSPAIRIPRGSVCPGRPSTPDPLCRATSPPALSRPAHRGPIGAGPSIQSEPMAGAVAGSSTGLRRLDPIYLIGGVNRTGRLRGPSIEDHDTGEGFVDGFVDPRRAIRTTQGSSRTKPRICRHVEPNRRHHEFAGRWGCGPTAFGVLSGHVAPSTRNRTRPESRTSVAPALFYFGTARPGTRGFTRWRGRWDADPSDRRVCR